MLKQLSINVPLVEAFEQIPIYAMFMKDLITKTTLVTFEDDDRMQHCSAIATRSLVQKKEDPGAHYKISSTKEKRSRCVQYSLYNWVITFCESIM